MTDARRQQIEQIYLDALDIPAVDRPDLLDRSCAGDRALRSEVELLLALQSGAETFLEQPAIESAARTLADIMPALKPPEISGYQIIRNLGEGGMGLVYLAEQHAPLHRLVALKVIRPGMDSRELVARFNAERQALARMDHPNIAAIHDAGTTADGRPYFVMEFVDGLPISEYCDRKSLPTVARLELFTQVCAAVQHAHQKGVIHRDLKPSNVLVAEQDGRPVPKVIDFGTAKPIAQPGVDGSGVTLTAHGTVLGTVEYMSPEQAAFSGDIDTTTDVYSLGVVLYELLVGVLPFERPRPGPEGYDELRRLIRESDPPRPSARLAMMAESRAGIASARQTDPDRLRRSLKGDLDWITLKALEKDRARRYPTAAALAADVHRFLSDQTVDARPPSSAYRIRKFTRRHRGAVAAAVSLLGVLVAGLAGSLSFSVELTRQGKQTESERVRADSERATAVAALDLADYRNYVITIAAAYSEVRASRFSHARELLDRLPATPRGWEWDHLYLRAESTQLTLADRAPCASGGANGANALFAADRLGKDPDGKRIYLRHCSRVNSWDTDAFAHAVTVSRTKNIAISTPSARTVEASMISDPATTLPSDRKWNLYVADSMGVGSPNLVGTVDREPACADLSQDGSILAIGFRPVPSAPAVTETDTFEVWDTRDGRRISQVTLRKPPTTDTRFANGVSCFVRLSPDATFLAASGAVVGIWQADTRARDWFSAGPGYLDLGQSGGLPQAIAFSPTGQQLAIGRRNGLIDVVDYADSKWTVTSLDGGDIVRPRPLNEHDRVRDVASRKHNEVQALAFSPDGQTITSSLGNQVIVWDRPSTRVRKVLDAHQSRVTGLVVDEQRIYSSDADGIVKVDALEGSSGVTRITGSLTHFSADAKSRGAAGASTNGLVSVWHPDERRQVVLRPSVSGIHIGTGSSMPQVASVADKLTTLNKLMRWGHEFIDRTEPGCTASELERVAVSPNRRYLALQQGPCVIVRDMTTTKTLASIRVDRAGFNESSAADALFLSDESILIAASHRRSGTQHTSTGVTSLRRWNWTTRGLPEDRLVLTPTTPPLSVVATEDGRRIALSGGGLVTVWDDSLADEIGRISLPPNLRGYILMALSADGARLATATLDEPSILIWDTATSQLLLTLTDDDAPRFLAFTSAGQLIASNSSGDVTIWETQRSKGAKSAR